MCCIKRASPWVPVQANLFVARNGRNRILPCTFVSPFQGFSVVRLPSQGDALFIQHISVLSSAVVWYYILRDPRGRAMVVLARR